MNRGIVIVTIVAGFLGILSIRSRLQVDGLEAQLNSVKLSSAATDVLVAQVRQDAASDSARADSVEAVLRVIRRDLTQARARSARVIIRVDSVRLTMDEDTLTAGVRNLLAAERAVCEACAAERDLERRRADVAETENRLIGPQLDASRLLVYDLQAQRDTALAIGTSLMAQINPGFWRGLFLDLPEIGAGAAAGAAVATLNDGDVLLGAGIGAAVALVFKQVF